MPTPLIIGRSTPRTINFVRNDGHDIKTGYAVAYALRGFPFRIIITRHGIDIGGEFPMVGVEGARALIGVLLRAMRQHEHLKSFPEGIRQQPLSEEMLEAELSRPPVSKDQESKPS